jgi:hypothetical protein
VPLGVWPASRPRPRAPRRIPTTIAPVPVLAPT